MKSSSPPHPLLGLAAFCALAAPVWAGALLRYDFNRPGQWPGVATKSAGTVDVQASKEASGAAVLTVERGEPAVLTSGLLAVNTLETNLGKLTLSFDHSISVNQPITLRVESFDAAKARSGGLETTLYPATADFFQRAAIELSAMKPAGKGAFAPTDPFVQISFTFSGPAELHIDNLAYASPAFYVSPRGRDTNDGRTEESAFASPQKAIDVAQPGDVILLMNGRYERPAGKPAGTPVANFSRPGTPAAWITLKNYPGHAPVLSAHGQVAVNIQQSIGAPILAYLEIRGLHILGNGETAREQYAGELGTTSPNVNSQGIFVNGRATPPGGKRTANDLVHHIRIAGNVAEYCTSDGIFVRYCDWVTVVDNHVRNNCWTTVNGAPAGLTLMGHANFDAQENVPKILVAGNQASGNRLYVKNSPDDQPVKTKFYNGNGILLDSNAEFPPGGYLGRTLVQNNLAFNNGGCGIQMWGSHRLDVANNTVYHNGTTPEMKWGQVGFDRCKDVRFINNIIVAQPDRPLDTWLPTRADRNNANIVRQNNLYWGGAKSPVAGENDLVADPQFVNPTTDPVTADFRLKPNSPALKAGRQMSFAPLVDLAGARRPSAGAPDLGTFQH